jgi:signal peptidase I
MRQSTHLAKNSRRLQRIYRATENIIFLVLLLVTIHFTLQNFHIIGQSMEPTLHDQEYILVYKSVYSYRPPARGDIIVFQYPLNPRSDYIKRIIAVPGDVISVLNQTVIVNGVTLSEPYVNRDDPYNPYPSFRKRIVGPDQYFVMGDNRGDSSDSREWGFVPRHNIIGQALIVYWPINTDNFGLLPTASNVFSRVRQ